MTAIHAASRASPIGTVLSHNEYLRTRIFPALDGVRAVAVLWVLGVHGDPIGLAPVDLLLHAGYMGVDLFFVLSGFLITTLLLRERPRPRGATLRGFYLRRALRIFPLYYAAIPLFWLVAWASGVAGDVEQFYSFLPALLFYWADWFMAASPGLNPRFAHSWSLAIEEKFYLLWPMIVLCGAVVARRVAITAIVAVAAWRVVLLTCWSGSALGGRLYFPFEARFDTLMWGALLAVLLHQPSTYLRLCRWCARPLVFWTVLAVFLLLVLALPERLAAVLYTVTPPLIAVALAGLVLRPDMPGLGVLLTPAMTWVGRISYGVYVLHPLCISLLHGATARWLPWLPGWISFPAQVGTSIACASASYVWFEGPLLRLKERFR